MALWWKLSILIGALLAFFTQLEVINNKWISSKSLLLKSTPEDAFTFVTTLDYVNKWFPFVHRVKEADGRVLGAGKKLYAVYDVPFYGEYPMVYKISEFKREKLLVIEGDNLLQPRIEFHFVKMKERECKLTVSITFRRLSYAFQYTLGPILNFVINQKLQHSLFLLQSVFPY